MVHHVIDESAPLYILVDDITVLRPTVGYILSLPSFLILPDPRQLINFATSLQARSPCSGGNKQEITETESICISNVKKIVDYAILMLPKDGLIFLVLHNRIFGSDRQIIFDKQDVKDFAKVNTIGASMISAYVGCLFDKISKDCQLADKYCFVDPQNISSYVDSNVRVTMLEEKLMTLTNIDLVVIL
ncbi:hypothetical protein AXF42_Ash014227 [Apostasia shenzhenica]|uniref:Uncharacterized protein n=1 Tax=Apostasia shenzhenica TaxID=1088818 RepID=A0A2I0A1A6_9ASPA|nr:hypothetical protein AXF42_Ash014227 [Apostasia shenzhenica]